VESGGPGHRRIGHANERRPPPPPVPVAGHTTPLPRPLQAHGEHHPVPLLPLRRIFPPLARPRSPSAAGPLLRRRAAPLLAVASPARAQHRPPSCSSDLRVSRSSFCTRPQPKWPTGAPDRPAPASSPPRSSAPAAERRRPAPLCPEPPDPILTREIRSRSG
jgi:hypothetical protein